MNISVVYEPSVRASASPYRLRNEDGRELDWANAFLDAQRLRQLSLRSLRAYAYDLVAVSGPVGFELVRRGRKWDKENRNSQGLCSGVDPPRS